MLQRISPFILLRSATGITLISVKKGGLVRPENAPLPLGHEPPPPPSPLPERCVASCFRPTCTILVEICTPDYRAWSSQFYPDVLYGLLLASGPSWIS